MRYSFLALFLVGCSCKEITIPKEIRHVTPGRALATTVVGDVPLDQNRNAELGYPKGAAQEILISRDEYLLSWSKTNRDANWSAWQLTRTDIGDSGRSNDFEKDHDLEHVVSNAVGENEYKGSCLDRGHITPSGDRTSSRPRNLRTFYMSNMLPQSAHLNRTTWEHLEEFERSVVQEQRKNLYIFAGPIYGPRRVGIGPKKDIIVPDKFFKILADENGHVLVAVIMPNLTSTGTDPIEDHKQACYDSEHELVRHGVNDDWKEYSVTIETIATETGLRFDFLKSP